MSEPPIPPAADDGAELNDHVAVTLAAFRTFASELAADDDIFSLRHLLEEEAGT
jgi:hypothetical protein